MRPAIRPLLAPPPPGGEAPGGAPGGGSLPATPSEGVPASPAPPGGVAAAPTAGTLAAASAPPVAAAAAMARGSGAAGPPVADADGIDGSAAASSPPPPPPSPSPAVPSDRLADLALAASLALVHHATYDTKNVYNSVEQLAALLSHTRPSVVVFALETLGAMLTRSPKLRVTRAHTNADLANRLLALAVGWGGKESALGLADCLRRSPQAVRALSPDGAKIHLDYCEEVAAPVGGGVGVLPHQVAGGRASAAPGRVLLPRGRPLGGPSPLPQSSPLPLLAVAPWWLLPLLGLLRPAGAQRNGPRSLLTTFRHCPPTRPSWWVFMRTACACSGALAFSCSRLCASRGPFGAVSTRGAARHGFVYWP